MERVVYLILLVICEIRSEIVVRSVPPGGEKPKDSNGHKWHYDEKAEGGPQEWYKYHADCAGHFQSPIALWQDDVIVDKDIPEFELIGYDKPLDGLQMENNGHTVKIEGGLGRQNLKIRHGGLPSNTTYKLAQIHFHWGVNDRVGSEHTLGNHYYPFEMHLVHIREPLNLAQALKDPQGLAVLGVFFEHSDAENNTALTPLIEVMHKIREKSRNVKLKNPIKARDLLPQDVSNFFRYPGSLTTPPCSQVVTWTIFVNTHPITTQQLDKFRSVRKSDYVPIDADEPDLEGRLLFNHRPVQPVYERKVRVREELKTSLPVKSASRISVFRYALISIASVILLI